MNGKQLYEKRISPAMNAMYQKSVCYVPDLAGKSFSFDDVVEYSETINSRICSFDQRPTVMIPFRAFYLPQEEFEKILKEAKKGLRYHWRWGFKSEIFSGITEADWKAAREELEGKRGNVSKEEFDELDNAYRRKYDHFIFNEYRERMQKLNERLENKDIDRKQYNKEVDSMAREYKMDRRSRDAESVSVELSLGCSPISNENTARVIADYVVQIPQGLNWEDAIVAIRQIIDSKHESLIEDIVSMYRFLQNYLEAQK